MNRIPALPAFAIGFLGLAAAFGASRVLAAAPAYVPQAVYCATGTPPPNGSPLCSTVPGDIGPDPALGGGFGYQGFIGVDVTSAKNDVETPFDNLSWQSFVALNWTAGKENQPAEEGLESDGPRVWQTWSTMAQVFGDAPVTAHCAHVPPGLPVFAIGSDGKGHPDGHNEEYIQAATGDPAIDVDGNWTLYERRLNDVEIGYLEAPGGDKSLTLTTISGQKAFMAKGKLVSFPAVGPDPAATTGSIEIKAAWRILDPAQHAENAKRFFITEAFLTVAPDLVAGADHRKGQPICAPVELGLVAMHIIQKNPVTKNALLPQWFWSTFEHVDNAPLAAQACDPAKPSDCTLYNKVACPATLPAHPPRYSYFNLASPKAPTNQAPTPAKTAPQFSWYPKQPYALKYLSNGRLGTQISRCWKNYVLTDALNAQWRAQLAKVGTVFQNYMLIGTQWGANVEAPPPPPPLPGNAVPMFLSNTVVETYLQTSNDQKNVFNNGSCLTCHTQATLANSETYRSDFSFAPGLAEKTVLRRPPIGEPGHATEIEPP